MKTDDTDPCMATRSNVLTNGCPDRRATSLTKLSGYITSPCEKNCETNLSCDSPMDVSFYMTS